MEGEAYSKEDASVSKLSSILLLFVVYQEPWPFVASIFQELPMGCSL